MTGHLHYSLEDYLQEFIRSVVELDTTEIKALLDIAMPGKVKKKELIAESGKECRKVLFIGMGYFRFYHSDYNGNEITSDFYFAPSFISSYTSFLTGQPSTVNVQAMQDMDTLEFSRDDLYRLYDRFPGIERLGRLVAESVAITSEEHLFLLLNQTAEMRYKRLLERYPQYINTIPLQYIASYLGIAQETLSRIRKSVV